MTGEEPTEPQPGSRTGTEPLPEPVRQRVVALAAAVIGGMPADEVPAALRKVASFAPNRRARLGGPAIAAQLAADPLFRQRAGGPGPRRRPATWAPRSATAPCRPRPTRSRWPRWPTWAGRRAGASWSPAAAETLKDDADSSAARGPARAPPSTGPPGPSTSGPWPRSRPRSCATSWPGCGPRPTRLRDEVRTLTRSAARGQAAQREARRRAAGHREGPGRPGRGRRRGRAAPAARPSCSRPS